MTIQKESTLHLVLHVRGSPIRAFNVNLLTNESIEVEHCADEIVINVKKMLEFLLGIPADKQNLFYYCYMYNYVYYLIIIIKFVAFFAFAFFCTGDACTDPSLR